MNRKGSLISEMRSAYSSAGAKRTLNLFGGLLGIAGLAAVSFKLWAYRGELDAVSLSPVGYISIALAAVITAASNSLLALAWRSFLLYLGESPDSRWALWAYSTSQVAKYVPGNIFHYTSRQVIGAAAGIRHGALAKSAGLELIVIAAVAMLFLPLVVPKLLPSVPVFVGVIAFLCIAAICPLMATKMAGRLFGRAVLYYLIFLGVAGAVFVSVFVMAGATFTAAMIPLVGGAYVLAWLLGLITPGAPAGVGVREAALLYLLVGLAPPAVILLAVVLGRGTTVTGDLLFYAWGQLWKRKLIPKSV